MRALALAGPLVAAMALPFGSGASPRAAHDSCRGVQDTIALYGDVDGDGRPDAVYVVQTPDDRQCLVVRTGQRRLAVEYTSDDDSDTLQRLVWLGGRGLAIVAAKLHPYGMATVVGVWKVDRARLAEVAIENGPFPGFVYGRYCIGRCALEGVDCVAGGRPVTVDQTRATGARPPFDVERTFFRLDGSRFRRTGHLKYVVASREALAQFFPELGRRPFLRCRTQASR